MATQITDNKERLDLVGELVKLGKLTLAEAITILKVEDAQKEKEYIFLPTYVQPINIPQPTYIPYPSYPYYEIGKPYCTPYGGTPLHLLYPNVYSGTPPLSNPPSSCAGTDYRVQITDWGGTGGRSIVVFTDCDPMPINSTSTTYLSNHTLTTDASKLTTTPTPSNASITSSFGGSMSNCIGGTFASSFLN